MKKIAKVFVLILLPGFAHAISAPYPIGKNDTRRIEVDLGDKDDSEKDLRTIVVVTKAATFRATFVKKENRCENLCGEPEPGDTESTPPTCHEVGIYRAESDLPKDLAGAFVLAGDLKLKFLATPKAVVQGVARGEDWRSETYSKPLGGFEGSYRWAANAKTKQTHLEVKYGEDNFDATPLTITSFERSKIEDFTLLRAPDAALLYHGQTLLVVSFAEYGTASADIFSAFEAGGERFYAITIGLKGQSAIGLLRRRGKAWELLYRPISRPRMC